MSFGGTGLRDWLIQRISAVYLALYLIILLVMCSKVPVLDYQSWRALILEPYFRLGTMIAFIALAMHAWIGIWTIATDYIKPYCIRWCFLSAVIFVLVGELIWSVDLLWGGLSWPCQ